MQPRQRAIVFLRGMHPEVAAALVFNIQGMVFVAKGRLR